MEPPAFRADLMPLHVTALDVELGESVPDFGLRVPVEVPGVVRFNAVGDNAGAPVDAELRFVATRGIPGYRFEATTQTTAGTGEYRVLLPPGTYDVTVDPDRNDAARSTIRGVEVRGAGDFRAFNVPAPAQYAVVTGVVERQADSAVPLTGARVSAQTTDGRLESTSDTTDESGRFVLLVPPSEAEWVLRVRSSDEADWVPNATFEAIPLGVDTTSGNRCGSRSATGGRPSLSRSPCRRRAEIRHRPPSSPSAPMSGRGKGRRSSRASRTVTTRC